MQVSNSTNYLQQYLSSQSAVTGAAGRYGQSSTNASQAAAPASANPVTLSDAARALSAQDNGSNSNAGSSDFSQEAQLLGGFAEKALAAMGVISPSDESGVQVSFDSLAYQVDSSVSASQTQQGGQVASQISQEQDANFSGAGHITLADGETFDFQIQLKMDQSEQYSSQGAADASTSAQSPSLPLSASPATAISDSSASPDASSTSQAQGTGSGLINWDAILKQSKSLIDLLDSLASSGLSPATTSSTPANSATGSVAAASA